LIDRIDIHVELASVPVDRLLSSDNEVSETSATVAARVAFAHGRQIERQGKPNCRLTPAEVAQWCRIERDSRVLLSAAITRLGLSARACHRVLKVARTCADLAGETNIRRIDVSEAVTLRTLDRLTC